MDLLNSSATDAIADALSAIRVRSSVYCLSELRAPWGFRVEGADMAKFHLVLEGDCWLATDGQDPVRLCDGDLVILSAGHGHVMRDEAGSAILGLDSLVAGHLLDGRLSYGGTGARTRLLCGGFGVTDPLRLLGSLPPVLRLENVTGWLEPVPALVQHEADNAGPGSQAIFAKLADVLLSQALRSYLTRPEQNGSLLGAHDALMERAAELLRQQPDRQWTLQLLAREVGMSRTLLASRFRAATGQSPMRHLAKVRLGKAADYLTTADLSIEAIARRTGYASNASLSKAFKREFGMSPGTYRRDTALAARVS